MNFLRAYFGSFPRINAYVFKGLLGHKNPAPTAHIRPVSVMKRPSSGGIPKNSKIVGILRKRLQSIYSV
jgi:hypothetical protein